MRARCIPQATLTLRTPPASALAVLQLGHPVGAAEAVARIGLVVAAAHRLEALALAPGDAELGCGHAYAARRRAGAGRRLAPKALVANSSGRGVATGLSERYGVGLRRQQRGDGGQKGEDSSKYSHRQHAGHAP